MENKVSLRDLFLDLQAELEASLGVSRRHVTHPSAMGDASELRWIQTLKAYLPLRYQAEKAFVIDHEGTRSEQIDVVVFDRQYCPFLMNHNGTLYVPAESVYAVFEVKQDLSKSHIGYAGDKAASVRALKRTNAAIEHAGGRITEPKAPFRILSGLLTLDCGWSEPLGGPFSEAMGALSPERAVDLGCCVRCGSFECPPPGVGSEEIRKSDREMSLVFFILRLLHRLQKLGTVPAIELDAYLRQIEYESNA